MRASTSGRDECLRRGWWKRPSACSQSMERRRGRWRALGYKQAVQLLRGELSREEAIVAAQQAHRNYAKRQMTWFRRESGVEWIAGFGDDPDVQDLAVAVVRK